MKLIKWRETEPNDMENVDFLLSGNKFDKIRVAIDVFIENENIGNQIFFLILQLLKQ